MNFKPGCLTLDGQAFINSKLLTLLLDVSTDRVWAVICQMYQIGAVLPRDGVFHLRVLNPESNQLSKQRSSSFMLITSIDKGHHFSFEHTEDFLKLPLSLNSR